MHYSEFILNKSQLSGDFGFNPIFMPDKLFDFQKALVEWAVKKGRAAIFADCGLGKTFIQLAWAQNIVEKTNGRILILTPLAVSWQTVKEAEKIGVLAYHSRGGVVPANERIIVTNYEQLHKYDANDFCGIVCDESSILKNYTGKMRTQIIDFMEKKQFRLLCTATAAPNDYVELGNSSEALGVLSMKFMKSRFFTHDGGDTSSWKLKGHARKQKFWQWLASWAVAVRKPSDLGFEDHDFVLPPLKITEYIVKNIHPANGYLFHLQANTLEEQRQELRDTLEQRCEKAAEILSLHNGYGVAWCHLNAEGALLEKMIPGSVNVEGSDSEEKKEEAFIAFVKGDIKTLISKPSIAGFGMNWQHCSRMTYFPSHSYEQFYQSSRRCWRFGQKNDVNIDIITTEGQQRVIDNIKRKTRDADELFSKITAAMKSVKEEIKVNQITQNMEVPVWLTIK